MDNSGTRKEGCSHTYHGYACYAPIAAYMGEEGWCINLEFREGSQHSQNNFIPFLQETISRARSLTKKPLLFRLDSGHDAVVETRATLYDHKKVYARQGRELMGLKSPVSDPCNVLKRYINY
jgi:hypothetical protein